MILGIHGGRIVYWERVGKRKSCPNYLQCQRIGNTQLFERVVNDESVGFFLSQLVHCLLVLEGWHLQQGKPRLALSLFGNKWIYIGAFLEYMQDFWNIIIKSKNNYVNGKMWLSVERDSERERESVLSISRWSILGQPTAQAHQLYLFLFFGRFLRLVAGPPFYFILFLLFIVTTTY